MIFNLCLISARLNNLEIRVGYNEHLDNNEQLDCGWRDGRGGYHGVLLCIASNRTDSVCTQKWPGVYTPVLASHLMRSGSLW